MLSGGKEFPPAPPEDCPWSKQALLLGVRCSSCKMLSATISLQGLVSASNPESPTTKTLHRSLPHCSPLHSRRSWGLGLVCRFPSILKGWMRIRHDRSVDLKSWMFKSCSTSKGWMFQWNKLAEVYVRSDAVMRSSTRRRNAVLRAISRRKTKRSEYPS